MKKELTIFVPPNAITSDSIVILWDSVDLDNSEIEYEVYIQDVQIAVVKEADYTFHALKANHNYQIYIKAVVQNQGIIKSNVITVTTKEDANIYNVIEYGACGDGITLNTNAIQRAIEECCTNGVVYIPKGIFLSGALFLKSNMTLYLDEGAVLLGSSDITDYPIFTYRFEGREEPCFASLINTYDGMQLENISIVGMGKIDANGEALFSAEMAYNGVSRGRAVCLRNVEGIYIKDVTIKQSPAWCLHLIYSQHISINNIKIYTKYDEDGRKYQGIFNGDGFDPDSCKNVYVFHSMISSQDDCIAIKSGRDKEGRRIGIPSENIRITNCRFFHGFGIAIGSEMSGGVYNVLVRDCEFQNSYSFASIKAPRGRGGVVQNICFENIAHCNESLEHQDCKWFRGALNIDQFYSHDELEVQIPLELDETTPIFKELYFRNIESKTLAGNSMFICGLPESPIQTVVLQNMKMSGRYGMQVYNAQNIKEENLTVKVLEGEQNETFTYQS